MNNILKELLEVTFLRNPVWGIVVMVIGIFNLESSSQNGNGGIILGFGAAMIGISGYHLYATRKEKRTDSHTQEGDEE